MAFTLALLFKSFGMLAFVGLIAGSEYLVFRFMPDCRLKRILIADWLTGKTPETLADLRAQRDL